MSPIRGLNEACGACGRPAGDHTLREWNACIGTVTTDLPFEVAADDTAALAAASIRERFQLDPDLIVADHVVMRAVTLAGNSGPVRVCFPGLLHEFQIGVGGQALVTVAKVAFLGDVASMRGYGRLVRDSANGAANAAERAG